HLAGEQQCRRMIGAGGAESAGAAPASCRRIVEFRAVQKTAKESSRDQHLAGGQQRRSVKVAWSCKAAGAAPAACRRIVEVRATQDIIIVSQSARGQHLPGG